MPHLTDPQPRSHWKVTQRPQPRKKCVFYCSMFTTKNLYSTGIHSKLVFKGYKLIVSVSGNHGSSDKPMTPFLH